MLHLLFILEHVIKEVRVSFLPSRVKYGITSKSVVIVHFLSDSASFGTFLRLCICIYVDVWFASVRP